MDRKNWADFDIFVTNYCFVFEYCTLINPPFKNIMLSLRGCAQSGYARPTRLGPSRNFLPIRANKIFGPGRAATPDYAALGGWQALLSMSCGSRSVSSLLEASGTSHGTPNNKTPALLIGVCPLPTEFPSKNRGKNMKSEK